MHRIESLMVALTLLVAVTAPVGARASTPRLTGTPHVVNAGPGDQSDPHVSGSLVAYTSELNGSSEIRYHFMETGEDLAIPNGGATDFLSDVSGTTIVFTRFGDATAIFAFDVATNGPAVELAPEPGSYRRSAAVGGDTVAWQDLGFHPSMLMGEVVVYARSSGALTRLTDDQKQDKSPAVSPDGRAVAWTKCELDGSGCDVWVAREAGGAWTAAAVTGAEGEESEPDTNGTLVVYTSAQPAADGTVEQDLAWRALDGGPERRLALPGQQSNPSVSGTLVAFEHLDPGASAADVLLYDLGTGMLYRLTETPQNESLNDLSVAPDGSARAVWSVWDAGGYDVRGITFRLDTPVCEAPAPAPRTPDEALAVCADPGERPLLAELQLVRGTGKPEVRLTDVEATGPAVVCVDNGVGGPPSTSGLVTVGSTTVAGPSDFKKKAAAVAMPVVLEPETVLRASIAGAPGSAFRVRVLGSVDTCPDTGMSSLGVSVAARTTSGPDRALAWSPAAEEAHAVGCGASGVGPAALAALLALLAAWLRGRRVRPAPVPVRARRRASRV